MFGDAQGEIYARVERAKANWNLFNYDDNAFSLALEDLSSHQQLPALSPNPGRKLPGYRDDFRAVLTSSWGL